MPLRLRTRLASCWFWHSTKANLALTRHWTMGEASSGQSLTRRMAPLRNWRRSISDVPGGVLPTNNSRFTLFWAACWAAMMEVRAEGTMGAGVAEKDGRVPIEPGGCTLIDGGIPPDKSSRSLERERDLLLSSSSRECIF